MYRASSTVLGKRCVSIEEDLNPAKRLKRDSLRSATTRSTTIEKSSRLTGYLTPCESESEDIRSAHYRGRSQSQADTGILPPDQDQSQRSRVLRSASVISSSTTCTENTDSRRIRASGKFAPTDGQTNSTSRQITKVMKRKKSPSSKPTEQLKDVQIKRLRRNVVEFPWWIDQNGDVDWSFRFFNRPELQPGCDKCPEGCPCISSECPCYHNGTSCDLSCKCSSDSCKRRFPSCQCEDGCGSHCFCHMEGRECSDSCKCISCDNWSANRETPKLRVQPSGIPGAGAGLFAAQTIASETYIGVYDGRLVESRGAKQNGMIMDFAVSMYKCIRADYESSLVFKINHCSKSPNIKFYVMETKTGRKPVVFSCKQISPGEELLANYGENPEFTKFKPEPLPKNPRFVVPETPNSYTYTVQPEKQWHSMERVNLLRGKPIFIASELC